MNTTTKGHPARSFHSFRPEPLPNHSHCAECGGSAGSPIHDAEEKATNLIYTALRRDMRETGRFVDVQGETRNTMIVQVDGKYYRVTVETAK